MITKKPTKTKGSVYEVRLRDSNGKEQSRTFGTQREAKDFESTERADKARGTWIDGRQSKVTFSVWAAEWLESNPTKRPKSKATDESMIRLHMNPTLGGLSLRSITPIQIQRLVAGWVSATTPKGKKKFQPSTIRRLYAVLHAIFAAAVESEVLGRSPCKGAKALLPRIDPRKRHPLSTADLDALAGVLGDAYATMMYTGAVLGLRWGECAALRVDQTDFLNNKLTVAQGLSEVSGKLHYDGPKSAAGYRTMAVPPPLMVMLSAQLARRGLTAADADAFVFVSPKGYSLRYSNWRTRIWLPALKAVSLEGLSLGSHDLRRAACTAMVAGGEDTYERSDEDHDPDRQKDQSKESSEDDQDLGEFGEMLLRPDELLRLGLSKRRCVSRPSFAVPVAQRSRIGRVGIPPGRC